MVLIKWSLLARVRQLITNILIFKQLEMNIHLKITNELTKKFIWSEIQS